MFTYAEQTVFLHSFNWAAVYIGGYVLLPSMGSATGRAGGHCPLNFENSLVTFQSDLVQLPLPPPLTFTSGGPYASQYAISASIL